MPPKEASGTKRKAPLAGADSNIAPPSKKVAKGKATASTSAGPAVTPAVQKKYKYSDLSSLGKDLPRVGTVLWSNDDEEIDDDDDDDDENEEVAQDKSNGEQSKEKGKDDEEERPRVVTDKGFPITIAGLEVFKHIVTEQQKRDPDNHDLYISNDYAGYGMTEVLENVLADFNKILFKKDVSPLEKWSYIEGLGLWLFVGDLYSLIMNENSDGIKDIFNMFVTLMITGLEILSEHSLIGPDSAVPNANIFTLIMIKFLKKDVKDFGIENMFPRRIKIGEDDIQKLRDSCDARSKTPDWKKEWPSFKREHPGGKQYDITKMSKAEKKQHSLGGGGEW
ncbi:hypothetical protein VTL71DRAFT_12449 [Oculimacula yallundae]|uniref:Uncharacterized protein n=1 Tax=Oculimacula yallundae TaxID=86028 RepID=A0ABR4CMM5_9HELO